MVPWSIGLALAASFDGVTPLTETVTSGSAFFMVPYLDPTDGTPSVLLQDGDLSVFRLEVQATGLVRHELGVSFPGALGVGAATGVDFDPTAPPTKVVTDVDASLPLYDVLTGVEIGGSGREVFRSITGDIDGDGRADVLSTANLFLTRSAGWTSMPLPTPSPTEMSMVSDAGDVDGDGHHDLLVSTWEAPGFVPSDSGEVALLRGGPAGYDPSPLWTLDSGNAIVSIVPADTDGDGADELVMLGGAWAFGWTGTDLSEPFMLVVDDLDQPAPTATSYVLGDPDTELHLALLPDASLQPIGDADGDGRDDVLLAAMQFDNVQVALGQVHILSPAMDFRLDDAVYTLPISDQTRLPPTARTFDVNGDGALDIVAAGLRPSDPYAGGLPSEVSVDVWLTDGPAPVPGDTGDTGDTGAPAPTETADTGPPTDTATSEGPTTTSDTAAPTSNSAGDPPDVDEDPGCGCTASPSWSVAASAWARRRVQRAPDQARHSAR